MQLIPDSFYFNLNRHEKENYQNKQQPPTQMQNCQALHIACTVVMHKDRKNNPVASRNLDWSSLGFIGSNTLVINRKYTNKLSTVEISFPGFIGTLTGMNKKGFSIAMNICVADEQNPKGVPAGFYNRMILENCDDANQAKAFVTPTKQKGDKNNQHL